MDGIDTNILLRALIDDPTAPQQIKIVREYLSEQDRVFVAETVLPELIWVLHSVYGFAKPQLLITLDALLAQPKFVLQSRDWFAASVDTYRRSNIDFSDALILERNRMAGHTLRSFDRKLARMEGAKLLKSGA